MSDDLDSWKDKQLSRRKFLKLIGVGSLALGLGFSAYRMLLRLFENPQKQQGLYNLT
ncbi:MAG TPA: twin-arginine translocation signal domain-containing protein [Nitrososphaeraceae archaeon]